MKSKWILPKENETFSQSPPRLQIELTFDEVTTLRNMQKTLTEAEQMEVGSQHGSLQHHVATEIREGGLAMISMSQLQQLQPLTEYSDEPLSNIDPHEKMVLARHEQQTWTNIPHLVTHHSPDGFNWGYAGSGPADLALNICEFILRDLGFKGPTVNCYNGVCFVASWIVHQDFKRQWLENLSQRYPRYVLQTWRVRDWIIEQCTKQVQDFLAYLTGDEEEETTE